MIEELLTCVYSLKHRETRSSTLTEVFDQTVLARAKTFSFFQKDDIFEADAESESSESEGEMLELIAKRSTKHYATHINNEELIQKVSEEADQRRIITEKLAKRFSDKVLDQIKTGDKDQQVGSPLRNLNAKIAWAINDSRNSQLNRNKEHGRADKVGGRSLQITQQTSVEKTSRSQDETDQILNLIGGDKRMVALSQGTRQDAGPRLIASD